jgi:hypothetical protein
MRFRAVTEIGARLRFLCREETMPIHDWTRVDAGIFHHFHHAWIEEIQRALNRGLLPPGYYALSEQIAGGVVPDVLTLQRPVEHPLPEDDSAGGLALAAAPPKVRFHSRAEGDVYATRAKAVVVRHRSGHQVVAMVEIVSRGNKDTRARLALFAGKAVEALRQGIHLLVIDVLPPGPHDPQGIHKVIWDELTVEQFALPSDKPLTLAAYIGGGCPESFVEPVSVGDALPEMPVFLSTKRYVPLPLEPTCQSAWEAVPSYWRGVVASATGQS